MPLGLFCFLGILTVLSSLGVVLQRNPIHCLLALVLTLLSLGVLFIAEGAMVVGFLQIIVYAGAIMILFLFVIWLLNVPAEERSEGNLALKFFGTIVVAALLAELAVFLTPSHLQVRFSAAHTSGYGSIDALAETLFSQYLIAFEVTSVLLLVAVIGAVALARRTTAQESQYTTDQPAPARVDKAA
jgi:NADH-quinone oxidoreductase subunit J